MLEIEKETNRNQKTFQFQQAFVSDAIITANNDFQN